MKISRNGAETFTLILSGAELALLNNALNETLNAVEDWEFQTRTGATRDEARTLLDEIGRALGQ